MGIGAAVAAITGSSFLGTAVSIIGLGLKFVGQKGQKKAQKKAQQAAEASQRAQQKQQQLEQSRERRRQVQEARVARARAINAAVTQGVGTESTVVPGTTGGIQSQLASNLGFLSASSANIGAINTALGERSRALSDAATSGAISGLGSTIFSNAGAIGRLPETIGTIFSPTGPDISGGGGSTVGSTLIGTDLLR